MDNERERRQRGLREAKKRAREQREKLNNRPFSKQDERDASDLQRYLVRSNLSKAERRRRLTSEEVKLAIATWSLDELQQLWASRAQKLIYIEDCALLLAHIRHKAGIDPQLTDYLQALRYESVQALSGVLEERDQPPSDVTRSTSMSGPHSLENEPEASAKRVELVLRVIREGQAEFRRKLIDYYGAACMATGTQVPGVIDAAHIIPYGGTSTNALSNGLLLRKDIHALFDVGLINVDPNLVLTVSPNVADEFYRALSGKRLRFTVSPRISTEYLRRRMSEGVSSGLRG